MLKNETEERRKRCPYTQEEPVVQVSIFSLKISSLKTYSRWTKVKYLPVKFWFLSFNGFRMNFILNLNNFHFSCATNNFSTFANYFSFEVTRALVHSKLNFKTSMNLQGEVRSKVNFMAYVFGVF